MQAAPDNEMMEPNDSPAEDAAEMAVPTKAKPKAKPKGKSGMTAKQAQLVANLLKARKG